MPFIYRQYGCTIALNPLIVFQEFLPPPNACHNFGYRPTPFQMQSMCFHLTFSTILHLNEYLLKWTNVSRLPMSYHSQSNLSLRIQNNFVSSTTYLPSY